MSLAVFRRGVVAEFGSQIFKEQSVPGTLCARGFSEGKGCHKSK